jgi:hypothetical protein
MKVRPVTIEKSMDRNLSARRVALKVMKLV